MMDKYTVTVLAVIGMIAVGAAVGAVGALIFMLIWNALVPAIFGLGALSFWQAYALMFLIGIVGKIVRGSS